MRVTSKGQVTIPQALRERAGLEPGTEVEFDFDGEAVRLRRADGDLAPGERLVAHMRGRARPGGMSTDDIMRLTRGED